MKNTISATFSIFLCLAVLSPCSTFCQTGHSRAWHRHHASNALPNTNAPDTFSQQICTLDHFQLLCALPYDGRPHDVDGSCGHCGDALESGLTGAKLTAELMQNFQKDN